MPEESPIKSAEVEAPSVDSVENAGSDSNTLDSEEFEAKVAEVIKVIRPAVQADQGDIFLRSVDQETGAVNVELVGACVTCPASTQTLKDGLERILKQRVPGVTSVSHIGEQLAGSEGTAVSL